MNPDGTTQAVQDRLENGCRPSGGLGIRREMREPHCPLCKDVLIRKTPAEIRCCGCGSIFNKITLKSYGIEIGQIA